MFLKRYRGETVRDALSACRQDLGPNALVLSTTLVPARGWRGMMGVREVELTAGLDRDGSALRRSESEDRHPAAPPAPADEVTARLVAAGLDRELAEEVAQSMPARVRRGASPARLRDALSNRLSELADVARDYQPIEVFVGPPGAGKTTTIAKIAAQARARRGIRFSLIAADGFRVGAIDQLRTYADILDAPFHATPSATDLAAYLADAPDTPALVDTAGRSPSDPEARELFAALERMPSVRTHLVLPAATPATAARRIIDSYAAARPSRLVLTKLDEAESLSPLVGLLRDRKIPVSYICSGQRVPEDLAPATPDMLAACVLGDTPSVALH
jgi:flagellar biosynthesis protein FlhF